MTTASVIMNCLNCSKYLREAIDSVYAQTYKDWEILFWDNASTDNSAEIAKSYDGKLRYFQSKETVPLGKARNSAVEKARGKYIAFLDCDDIWEPEKLEKQVPLFDSRDVGLVYCDVIQFNSRGYAMEKFGDRKPPIGRVFDIILMGNFLCMSTVVIRKEIMKREGHWFDTRFTAIEDTDLFIRIARNWDFDYVPLPLSRYRMHESAISFSKPDLFRREVELTLEKYNRMYPEFKDRYEAMYREQMTYDDALVEWKRDNNAGARTMMRPLVFKNRKNMAVYLAMFFPFRIVNRIRALVSDRAISNY